MSEIKSTNIHWHEGDISRDERWAALKSKGATVWFTGLSGSGKSTIASAVEQALCNQGVFCYRLDGDNIRFGLNTDPKSLMGKGVPEAAAKRFGIGFSAEDRAENIRRIGEVAKLFSDAGVVALTSFISPYRKDRDFCRVLHNEARPSALPFIEIFVDTPLDVCEKRDPKGLYKKARAGEIKGFTGIDDPYEAPNSPELVLKTAELSVQQSVAKVIDLLAARGVVTKK